MILVTGGAGYIGSHVALELLRNGNDVVILDNLYTGHKETVQALKEIKEMEQLTAQLEFVKGETGDFNLFCDLAVTFDIESVVHLAAFSQVGESMRNPGKYYENNVGRAITILEAMAKCNIKEIVFSSTAAVYGEPAEIPIIETSPAAPTNVYGSSKVMVEDMLKWYDRIYNIKHVVLRYFNAAGADHTGMIGEWHRPETHLIPLVLQTILGKRDKLTIFGDDYPTADGTCIRDYIHVTDLAQAHILALEALKRGMESTVYNLGNGSGYSVKEVIDTAAEVTGTRVEYEVGGRRKGDPAVLVASSEKISRELGWNPQYSNLSDIISSAWKWHGNQG
jgi:UDP-glucose 4-epimerase